MRSARGVFASAVFLLALPVAALAQMALGGGGEAVIHGALALGSALMALAVFDFQAPRWATWLGAVSMGGLAAVFLLQGASELAGNETLTGLAYQVLGQRLEGWLVNVFLAWCVVVFLVDEAMPGVLGIVALATVTCVKAYAWVLAWQGTSLDAQVPILKVLWLTPFVWLLFAGKKRHEVPDEAARRDRGLA